MTNLNHQNCVTRTGWLAGIALLTAVAGCRSAALDRYTGRLPELLSLSFSREVAPLESVGARRPGGAQLEDTPDFEDGPDFVDRPNFEDGPGERYVELASSSVSDSAMDLQPPIDSETRELVAATASEERPSNDLLIPHGDGGGFEPFPEDDSTRQRAPLLPDAIGHEQATHSVPAHLTNVDDEPHEPRHLLDQIDGPIALFGSRPLEVNRTDDVHGTESTNDVFREISPEDPFIEAPADSTAGSIQEAGHLADESQHVRAPEFLDDTDDEDELLVLPEFEGQFVEATAGVVAPDFEDDQIHSPPFSDGEPIDEADLRAPRKAVSDVMRDTTERQHRSINRKQVASPARAIPSLESLLRK